MIYIGSHLSVTKGYAAMGTTMLDYGGNTFAFFTRNPRGGKSKELVPEDAAALNRFLNEHRFGPLVAHGSYTMNLFYNFHPGSHTGQGEAAAIPIIADALNQAMYPSMQTTVLLETMAGKGSEVGRSFEELKAIMDRVELQDKIGVCFDTCHTWDAGYDLVNDLDGVLTDFDKTIGLNNLKAIHLNDSKNERGSHKDRHEKLGLGCIGAEAMKRIVTHQALQGKPFILETPNDEAGYKNEIRMVREWMNG